MKIIKKLLLKYTKFVPKKCITHTIHMYLHTLVCMYVPTYLHSIGNIPHVSFGSAQICSYKYVCINVN